MGDLSASLFSPGANCGRAAEREGKEEVECCCFMSRPLSTHSRGGGGVVAPGWEEEEGRFFPPPPPFGKHTPTMQVRKWPTKF